MNKLKLIYNNKEIGFHFGLGFMGELLEVLDCPVDELQDKLSRNPFKVIPKIMFEAHKYDCYRQEKEVEYTLTEFIDLVDEDGGIMSDRTAKFLDTFSKSMSKDVPKENVNPETRKGKKPTPKKK